MFSGSFSQMSLVEVLRLLSTSSQTGRLNIQAEDFSACIDVYSGQLLHAETTHYSGLDALYDICRNLEGTFEFDPKIIPEKTSLAEYDPQGLIQNLETTLTTLRDLAAARPAPSDVPRFLKADASASVTAEPTELQLLLLADGSRDIESIASQSANDLDRVQDTFARFIIAGIVAIQRDPPAALSSQASPLRPPAQNNRPARYWRGKRID